MKKSQELQLAELKKTNDEDIIYNNCVWRQHLSVKHFEKDAPLLLKSESTIQPYVNMG